jgi:hypothetical protein
MTSASEASVSFRRRLIRGVAAALATVGLAAAVAAVHADAAGVNSAASQTSVDDRIGANHNQVLL